MAHLTDPSGNRIGKEMLKCRMEEDEVQMAHVTTCLKRHLFNMLRRGQSDTGSGYKAEQGAICAGTKEETRHLLLLLDNRVNLSCLSWEFVLK